jgi:T4 gene Gp59 loader of gp41 DNA helicase
MVSLNYANEESFRVYVNYLALKKHFESDGYDYHKYNGKVRASFDKFQTRNDAFFFYKLSKRNDPTKILLANIIHNQKVWIRDIVDETGENIFVEWEKRVESLTYMFKNDIKKLKENYHDNFVVKDGQHPYVMTLYLRKEISLETFSILARISNVYDLWEKEIVDKFIARDIIRLSKKYYPFMEVDQKKFSKIVKEQFFEDK